MKREEVAGRIQKAMDARRDIVCCHCGERFGPPQAGETKGGVVERALAHERQCPKNPLVAEIKRLRHMLAVRSRSTQ